MGLLNNLFGKKKEIKKPIQPQTEAQKEEPKGIIKEQHHIVEIPEERMEDIMDLVEKNEDYKLSKKELIEENREDEKIYEYELGEKATLDVLEDGTIQVIVYNTCIGTIKQGSKAKVNKLVKGGKIKSIYAEVSGGNYKILKYFPREDEYELEELESEFRITVEITYWEEIAIKKTS